jgi:uncharacterized protein DUF4129
MVSLVAPLLTGVSLAACFVIGLAATIRMSGPIAGIDHATGVIRLPREVTATIVSLFALAAVVFVAHLLWSGWSRRHAEDAEPEGAFEPLLISPWMRAVRQVLALLYFVTLAYLLSRSGITLDGIIALASGAGAAGGLAAPGPAAESAPPLVTWSFGILALGAGLGALGLATWVALGARLPQGRADGEDEIIPAPLGTAVDDSAEDLRSEPDARRAIVRCYARFERAAADSGVERTPWSTPMEFMREALRRLPVPRTAVPTLTGLFELARFSQHPLGPTEREQALEALDEIRTAMRVTDGDAGAR